MSKLLYTVPEVMEMLSISRSQTYNLFRSGALRSVKVGSLRRVPADALDNFLGGLPDDY